MSGSLTSREWDVLLYFIKSEGYTPAGPSPDDGEKTGDSCSPFVSYPAKIERDLGGAVTRGWASKICADFEARGIMGHVMIRPPRQKHETGHYFLKRDLAGLRAIARLVMEHARPEDRHVLFGFRYFRGLLGESLVREVLSEKKVEMWRTVRLAHWDTDDARRLFGRYAENAGITCGFDGYMRAKLYGNGPEDMPFDEISLRLPVFPDPMPKAQRVEAFERLNKPVLDSYPFVRFDSSGVAVHYKRWEREKLILPLLALIQISPDALAEFLYGGWTPLESAPQFTPEGTGMMEYVIFRLLFIAISDLASVRSIQGDGIARMAWLRKSNNVLSDSGQDALFTVALASGRLLYFDGGFDTVHDFYGNADGEFRPEEEMDYWARTWPGFDRDINRGLLLDAQSLADVPALIRRLRDPQDLLSAHIKGTLSFEMQRLLEYADLSVPVPELLLTRLLDELNEAILGECIYGAMAFKGVRLSDNTKKLLDNRLLNDTMAGTVEDYVLNRALLADAFPGLISGGSMSV